MFRAFNEKNDFSYAFEKISNAIASSEKRGADFAKHTALEILRSKYALFRQELSDAGELGNHEYDLDTYDHCINVLHQYFDSNPGGLTERDARVYSQYLQTEHDGFAQLAEELASGRG